MTDRGLYVVLEGPQGVGKTTLIGLLEQSLRQLGRDVRVGREPDSQTDLTARAIRRITQNPQFPINTRSEVLLYNAARSQTLEIIQKTTEHGIDYLVDRNYLTNFAVQYYGRDDQIDYTRLEDIIQFAVNGIEPDVLLILDAPVPVLLDRLSNRPQGERFDSPSSDFLEKVRNGYLEEAKHRSIPVINAEREPEVILQEVLAHISYAREGHAEQAPATTPPLPVAAEILPITELGSKISHPPVGSTSAQPTMKDSFQTLLERWTTNPTGSVYGLRPELGQVTAAAAMARLSRRPGDLRQTLLEEFSQTDGRDEQLIQRVVAEYGDDSVQQLLGVHVVVQGASNLLTKELEWGRLAAYLEQSTRYIRYDQKDSKGRYPYVMPRNLPKKLRPQYLSIMDQIFSLYSTVVDGLIKYLEIHDITPDTERKGPWRAAIRAQACDAARGLLPAAARSTVGIYGSAQAIEALIMRLRASQSQEANDTGNRLLEEVRKIAPVFFSRADQPERGERYSQYLRQTRSAMQELTDELLPTTLDSLPPTGPTLTDFFPKNELQLAADMVYAYSDQSEDALKNQLQNLSYDAKQRVFATYLGDRLNRRHKPGRALERAFYCWDIVCDYGIFRDLQRHRLVNDLQWQALTPRYGYDIPELVESAGQSDNYEKCFDLSLQLYSLIQAEDCRYEAQYATLLGHRMRCKLTINAREAMHMIELRSTPQGHPGYRLLVQQMYEQIKSVHPLIASMMKFVDMSPNPRLTRLAAEQAKAERLKKLDNQ